MGKAIEAAQERKAIAQDAVTIATAGVKEAREYAEAADAKVMRLEAELAEARRKAEFAQSLFKEAVMASTILQRELDMRLQRASMAK